MGAKGESRRVRAGLRREEQAQRLSPRSCLHGRRLRLRCVRVSERLREDLPVLAVLGGVLESRTARAFYHLLVCADDTKVTEETAEANNCGVGSVLQVTRPDLVETAVSDPPQTAKIGSAFSITDTAGNAGVLAAPASTARYYLSKDGGKGARDTALKGTRPVPSLGAKRVSIGSTLVTIPNVAAGSCHVLACADDLNVVKEVSETNNCAASLGAIQVTH